MAVDHRTNPSANVSPDRSLGWFRRIRPVVSVQKRSFAAATGAGFLSMAATVAVPITLGRGIDAIAENRSAVPFVIAMAVLALVRFVFGYLFQYGLFRSALRIERDLRNIVYRRLTELSFDYWDRTQTGQVISRANADIRSIQLLFGIGPFVAMQLALFTFAVAVMFSVDVTLTLLAISPLPFVFVVGTHLRNRVFPLQWVVTARQAEVATVVDENIQGIRVVKAFNQEESQLQKLAHAGRRLRWAGVQVAETRARHAPGMDALPRLGLALVLLYGGRQAIAGDVAIGDLVAFSTYVVLLATPLRMLGFVLIQWQRAGASALRVFEILDETPSVVEPSDPVEVSAGAGAVEFDDVRFRYPAGDGGEVLRGFSAVIEAGETVAIVGATGSGKSTAARLLPRFYDVDAGAVRLDGHDVRELSFGDLRSSVATVTEDPFLFAASIRDNVAYGRPEAEDHEVWSALTDAAAAAFVAELPRGFDTVVGERGLTLSGGQRQRIAIARALLTEPRVLILDDATSAIDIAVEEHIHSALRSRRVGRTTILIAHRLSTIALADRVILLDNGIATASGTHQELLAGNQRYASILADSAEEARSEQGVS